MAGAIQRVFAPGSPGILERGIMSKVAIKEEEGELNEHFSEYVLKILKQFS